MSVLMKQETPIWGSFLGFQQVKDPELSTADVNFICQDGIVPAHAFVLQAVSPFFDKMFSAQGKNYFGTRPVLLPEQSYEGIGRMIQFIYAGSIQLQSKKESKDLQVLLATFQVTSDNLVFQKVRGRKKTEEKALSFSGDEAARMKKVHIQPFVPLPEIQARKSRLPATSAENELAKSKSVGLGAAAPVPRKQVIPNSRITDSDDEHISSTDSSDGEIDDSVYKNTDWFLNESKKCQKCRKQSKTAAAASMCLTSHNRLRCYFCFKVVRNTEKLFQHFARKHKKAGRENCLMCPFCEQTVPFKSVSCHVISLHLADTRQQNMQASTGRIYGSRGPGRPPGDSVPPSSVPAGPTPKKARSSENGTQKQVNINEKGVTNLDMEGETPQVMEDTAEYKVQDLDYVMRKQSITGQIRVFSCKMKRPGTSPKN